LPGRSARPELGLSVSMVIAWIEQLKPRRAILTNLDAHGTRDMPIWGNRYGPNVAHIHAF